eukprot:TRINITY_DN74073_c0_g1_i1.p1 TRINITY_DN74073_c0_g1~~TRINITY_DN74073_c0_g1_i1.p1  ORF type:complete len:411 (-),score=27.64 TRINITY_DN74073_c0_g1_i1:162-1340(-)
MARRSDSLSKAKKAQETLRNVMRSNPNIEAVPYSLEMCAVNSLQALGEPSDENATVYIRMCSTLADVKYFRSKLDLCDFKEPNSIAQEALDFSQDAVRALRQFPEALPLDEAARCCGRCGWILLNVFGQYVDAARSFALEHRFFLQLPPCRELAKNLRSTSMCRFRAGYAEAAIKTLRYAIGNPALSFPACDGSISYNWSPWLLRHALASMLFLTGQVQEAARLAKPALDVSPEETDMSAFFLVMVRLQKDLTNRKALCAIIYWRDYARDVRVRAYCSELLSVRESGPAALTEYVSQQALASMGGGQTSPSGEDPCLGEIDDDIVKNLAASRRCAVCGTQDGHLQKCGKCKLIWYCGQQCQSRDWPTHKELCCRRARDVAAEGCVQTTSGDA